MNSKIFHNVINSLNFGQIMTKSFNKNTKKISRKDIQLHDLVMLHIEHAATYFAWSKDRYCEIKGKAFSPLEKLLHIQAYVISQIGLHALENAGILIRLIRRVELWNCSYGLTQYFSDVQIQKNEIGGECRA
jgi:hypothetical protein